jgi:predicted phosphate transport protein (TIGR00153 family)
MAVFGSSNRTGEKYFEGFKEMCGYSSDAAVFLKEILADYDPELIGRHRTKMHAIEHDGDVARHQMFRSLLKESKLPIEREDVVAMADAIDVITDSIEDVLLRLYMFDIREIRPEMLKISDVMIRIIRTLREALAEFPDFRTSKTLQEKLIEINSLEEEGDLLYIEAVRSVYTDEAIPPVKVAAWAHIFVYMEEVIDAVEDAADVIESVMMKHA